MAELKSRLEKRAKKDYHKLVMGELQFFKREVERVEVDKMRVSGPKRVLSAPLPFLAQEDPSGYDRPPACSVIQSWGPMASPLIIRCTP
eukprot:3704492-Pyramimonas_sp.AAC.1